MSRKKAESLPEHVCVSCKEWGELIKADKYCYECQANLCKICSKTIHAVQTHRDHCIISKSEGSLVKGTDEIKKIVKKYLTCSKHPDRTIRFECKDDNEFCCSDCAVLLHRNCKEVTDSKGNTVEETHEIATKLEDNIWKLRAHIEAILETKRSSELQSRNDAENIESKLRKMRAKVISLFDVLQENVGQQCKAYVKNIALYVTEDKKELEMVISRLKNCSVLIKEVSRHLPTGLAHVILVQVKNEIKECEKMVLEANHIIKKKSLHLEISDVLNSVISTEPNEAGSLAVLNTKVTKSRPPKYPGRNILKNGTITKVAESYITGMQHNIWGILSPIYRELVTFSNNQFLLVDSYAGRVVLVSADLKSVLAELDFMMINQDKVKDSRKPYSAADMKNGMAAITLPKQKKIYFVSICENLAVKGEYYTKYSPRAVQSMKNGDLAVSFENPVAFGVLALNRYSYEEKIYFDRDANGRVLKCFNYMAVDEKRAHIIQPCSVDKMVYCFDFQGIPKFTYSLQKLSCPTGVAIDDEGNIFVCEYSESVIHVLSEEGQLLRLIKDGCQENPNAIAFIKNEGNDGTRNYIITSWKSGVKLNVFRYQIDL